jgi:hypothetical protein
MNKLQNFLKPVTADLFAGRSDEPGQRLGERVKAIGLDQVAKCQLALIGFPEYAGIARNGGRLGVDSDVTEALAKLRQNHGPASVRKRLYSMTTGSLGMVLGAGRPLPTSAILLLTTMMWIWPLPILPKCSKKFTKLA